MTMIITMTLAVISARPVTDNDNGLGNRPDNSTNYTGTNDNNNDREDNENTTDHHDHKATDKVDSVNE